MFDGVLNTFLFLDLFITLVNVYHVYFVSAIEHTIKVPWSNKHVKRFEDSGSVDWNYSEKVLLEHNKEKQWKFCILSVKIDFLKKYFLSAIL